jgi:hypothetical protein
LILESIFLGTQRNRKFRWEEEKINT